MTYEADDESGRQIPTFNPNWWWVPVILWILAGLVLMLTGCADNIRSSLAVQGAQASDQLLADSEWGMCKAVSVGAWVRRFGDDPKGADAWRTICRATVDELPVETESDGPR